MAGAVEFRAIVLHAVGRGVFQLAPHPHKDRQRNRHHHRRADPQ